MGKEMFTIYVNKQRKEYLRQKRKLRKKRKKKCNMFLLKKNQSKASVYGDRLKNNPAKTELLLKAHLEFEGIDFMFQKQFFDEKHCYIVDFYFPRKNKSSLVVELDGESHNSQRAKIYDWERTVFLTSKRNCKVIRFKNEQVHDDVNGIVDAIKTYGLTYKN